MRDQVTVVHLCYYKALLIRLSVECCRHSSLGAVALAATGGGLCDKVKPLSSAVMRAAGYAEAT